jgi:hypothetical protein
VQFAYNLRIGAPDNPLHTRKIALRPLTPRPARLPIIIGEGCGRTMTSLPDHRYEAARDHLLQALAIIPPEGGDVIRLLVEEPARRCEPGPMSTCTT